MKRPGDLNRRRKAKKSLYEKIDPAENKKSLPKKITILHNVKPKIRSHKPYWEWEHWDITA